MSLGVLIVLLFGGAVLFLFLLGKLTEGDGADLIDWDPDGRREARREAEAEDIDELLERVNAERRRRGKPLLSPDNVLSELVDHRDKQG